MPRPPRNLSVRGGIKDADTLNNLRAIIEEVNNLNAKVGELEAEIKKLKGSQS